MKRIRRRDVLTPALLLLGPVFHVLRYYDYPLLRKEVLLVVGITALVGLIFGWIIYRVPYAVGLGVFSLVLALVYDLYVIGEPLGALLLIFGAIGLAVWGLRTHIMTIAFATSAAVLLSAILISAPGAIASSNVESATSHARASLPPVFHLVLDGGTGLGGLAGDSTLAHDMSSWLEHRGFTWVPNAYSSYVDTHNSLPNLVNFDVSRIDAQYARDAANFSLAVNGSRYFDEMRERGYAIRVYQSTYLDFCHSSTVAVTSCFTYPDFSLAYASRLPLTTSARARLIAIHVLAHRSYIFTHLFIVYQLELRPRLAAIGIELPRWRWIGPRVSVIPGDVFNQLERDLTKGSAGTLFFVHLMLPHSPYQYNARCRPNEHLSDWVMPVSPTAPPGYRNTPESKSRRLGLYYAQYRCVTRLVEGFFNHLDSLGVYDSALIVMHGDHGNRITIHPVNAANAGRLTRAEQLDAFSTLFAVKSPAIGPGADTSTVDIIDIMNSLVASNFRTLGVRGGLERPKPQVWLVNQSHKAMTPLDYASPGNVVK